MFPKIPIILNLVAILPPIYLLFSIYRSDRLEKESPILLFKLFLMGLLSTILAVKAEVMGKTILLSLWDKDGLAYKFFMFMIIVPLAEEGFKFLFLKWASWRSREFNCRFDGIIYSVFVSLGFALIENILYVREYGLGTGLGRALTAIPGHASMAIFMGFYYGLARSALNQGQIARSRKFLRLSLGSAVLIHGLYDFILVLGTYSVLFTGLFFIYMIIIFILANRIVKKMSRGDYYFPGKEPGNTQC